jgi:predicted phosphodiesterase
VSVRILAISDEVDQALGPESMASLRPDLVLSCGDLPADYLEYIVTVANVPLLWVPGNHDPDRGGSRHPAPIVLPVPLPVGAIAPGDQAPQGPPGCTALDGRVVPEHGLLIAGLGGSIRYSRGPNQYTQREMRRRAIGLELRTRFRYPGRGLDVVVTHSPPLGVGDAEDPAHRGFASFHRLMEKLSPQVLIHGHVHPYGAARPDRRIGRTRVVNAIPHQLIEVEA